MFRKVALLAGVLALFLLVPSVSFARGANETAQEQVVNLYSHRHYDADKQLYDAFTKQTGIKVQVVQAGANELIERLKAEGANSPADVLITVDIARLWQARQQGLLQKTVSPVIEANIPAIYRDKEGYWVGLTKRARIIVYDKTKFSSAPVSRYEDLTDSRWAGKVLVRSSTNEYNISLLATMIGALGSNAAQNWATGVVGNFARDPQGSDRDQAKALIAGQGELAIMNTYYIGLLINSAVPEEQDVGKRLGIVFPNQGDRGTHINMSAAGLTANAPNKANALRFIEFLTGAEAQKIFAEANYEYPVNPKVQAAQLLASWGSFKEDTSLISTVGEYAEAAVRIFDESGWR